MEALQPQVVELVNAVDKFHFVIKEGKIVEVHAEVGEAKLKAETTLDEGASYFGEVALVPYDSPISNQRLLFYETLFDENASCHLAFGEAYSECIKGGTEMSKEEPVKISSVGMLGMNGTPAADTPLPPAHTWSSGRRITRSVPKRFV